MRRQFSFEAALEYVASAQRFGIHPSLDTIRALAAALGHPERTFRVAQVAGTNGKTSVARITAALLRSQGVRDGHFTSPTLGPRTDQIAIGGTDIAQDAFAAAASAVAAAAEDARVTPTEFEIATASALWAFREAGIEWAVLEVGMGGRWDATSVAAADVAVVTGIDLDHTDHLGPTREAVAREKAQIIVSGSRAVLGPGTSGVLEVFLDRAQEVEAPVALVTRAPLAGDAVFEVVRTPAIPGGEMELAVKTARHDYDKLVVRAPSYQAPNVAVALTAAETALGRRLDAVAARRALTEMRFPGRFEVLDTDPWVVADGAHNPAAAAVLATAVEEAFGQERPWIVLGVLSDKDAEGIVSALARVARGFVATQSESERSREAAEIAEVVERVTGIRPDTVSDVGEAVRIASARGPVVATGSLTVAAETRRAFGLE